MSVNPIKPEPGKYENVQDAQSKEVESQLVAGTRLKSLKGRVKANPPPERYHVPMEDAVNELVVMQQEYALVIDGGEAYLIPFEPEDLGQTTHHYENVDPQQEQSTYAEARAVEAPVYENITGPTYVSGGSLYAEAQSVEAPEYANITGPIYMSGGSPSTAPNSVEEEYILPTDRNPELYAVPESQRGFEGESIYASLDPEGMLERVESEGGAEYAQLFGAGAKEAVKVATDKSIAKLGRKKLSKSVQERAKALAEHLKGQSIRNSEDHKLQQHEVVGALTHSREDILEIVKFLDVKKKRPNYDRMSHDQLLSSTPWQAFEKQMLRVEEAAEGMRRNPIYASATIKPQFDVPYSQPVHDFATRTILLSLVESQKEVKKTSLKHRIKLLTDHVTENLQLEDRMLNQPVKGYEFVGALSQHEQEVKEVLKFLDTERGGGVFGKRHQPRDYDHMSLQECIETPEWQAFEETFLRAA